MNGVDLIDMVRQGGKKQTYHTLMECMSEPDNSPTKLRPVDFSLKELWEALVGPCSKTLSFAKKGQGYIELEEAAVDSSLYQSIAGRVISDMVIEGYNRIPGIADNFVQVFQTKQRYDKVPGFTPTEGVKTVEEGESYEFTGIGHKYVGTGDPLKKGRILAITEEAVFFDRTSMILGQAEELGKDARLDREKTILSAIMGITPSYFPGDVPTTLYTALPQFVSANPLSDWRNIEKAEIEMAETKDEEDNPIVIMPNAILVPTSLQRTAQRILNATEIREKKNTSSPTEDRETISANPVQNLYQVFSSPLVHQLQILAGTPDSEAKSNWWFGDFSKQFCWKELWPLQVQRAREGHEDEFRSDVVAQFKVRYYGVAFAKDFRFVQKNKAT